MAKQTDIIPIEKISSKIYFIKNEKVLIDRDLANLYGVETRVLKQAVRRNKEKFPNDFMFVLSKAENVRILCMKCNLSKSNKILTLPPVLLP